MVGRFLAGQAAYEGREVLGFTSSEWDITGPDPGVLTAGDVVVNCAAFTQVDLAEEDPDRAHAVNATGAGNVATACARAGASLIHISTDYVFGASGARTPYDIDDETGPLSVYGRTKLAGEHAVLAALPTANVVRTSWVYEGADGSDFVAAMRRTAAGTEHIDVVADQIGSPTYVGDLCGVCCRSPTAASADPCCTPPTTAR